MNKNTSTSAYPRDPAIPARSARDRVGLRTRELALLAGRRPPTVTQADYEQAKQDVTGESIPARQDLILDAVA